MRLILVMLFLSAVNVKAMSTYEVVYKFKFSTSTAYYQKYKEAGGDIICSEEPDELLSSKLEKEAIEEAKNRLKIVYKSPLDVILTKSRNPNRDYFVPNVRPEGFCSKFPNGAYDTFESQKQGSGFTKIGLDLLKDKKPYCKIGDSLTEIPFCDSLPKEEIKEEVKVDTSVIDNNRNSLKKETPANKIFTPKKSARGK
jgi:hypothetical protein